MSSNTDSIQRFSFDDTFVRGQIVHLDQSLLTALSQHNYAPEVQKLLAEAVVMTVLMRNIVKFIGKMTLQIHNTSALRLLVAQCNEKLEFRAVAHMDENFTAQLSPESMLAGGQCAVTMEPEQGERYQGIVALQENSLVKSIEHYFQSSEQLPTRLYVASSANKVSALFLQQMPCDTTTENDNMWEHITTLAQTISEQELLTLDNQTILHRLFHQEKVRLYDQTPVQFRCGCDKAGFITALKTLPKEEQQEILDKEGQISISCDYCNQCYDFTAADLQGLTH